MFNIFGKKKDKQEEVSNRNNLEVAKLKLKDYKRVTYKPITNNKFTSFESSKLGGLPYIPESQEWPSCQTCNEPLQFFVQLNSADLPEEANKPFGEGVLQMFYCLNHDKCENGDDWEPFSNGHLLRILYPMKELALPLDTALTKEPFTEKTITDWKVLEEYPHYEEHPEGIELSEAEALCDNLLHSGEKLLGWPSWVQGEEYPTCPKCSEKMNFIFQIDSEDNLNYMFGDVGCGHITQCGDHPEVIAFSWACC